jgi:hypothetical protein
MGGSHTAIYSTCMKCNSNTVRNQLRKSQCFFQKRLFISDLASLLLSICSCSIASIDFFALQTIRNLANVFESLTGFMQRLNDLDLANVYITN